MKIKSRQRFNRHEKSNGIDLGLAVLSAIRQPGEHFTYDVMAAACGCARSAIYQIERNAMRKLANRLQFQKDPALREAVASIIGRDL